MNHANYDYFLPSIQREFKWFDYLEAHKVEKLFDSLLQEYPIGNIIIWNYNKKEPALEKLEFEVYKFIESWEEDNPHNVEASLNGVNPVHLVLDGQQRLTSLLIGLRGRRTYTKYRRSRTERLYINLISNIEKEKNNVDRWRYELKFLEDFDVEWENENTNKLWVEVGKVLNFKDKNAEDFKESLADFVESKVVGDLDSKKKALNTLGQMHNVFCHNDTLIESYVYKEDEEDVLDIFTRVNQSGTELEKSDMLLSNMESNKSLFKPNGARKEVISFVDQLNKVDVDKPEYYFGQNFVLKASLVLSDLEVQYKLKNFNKENLSKISENWTETKKYLMMTVKLLGKYRFTYRNILSENALIPICYYLMHNREGESFVNSTYKDDLLVKDSIIRWFATALLEGLFGGSSDTTLTQIRKRLKEGARLEDTLEHQLKKEDIEKVIDKARYNKPLTRLILMLVSDQKYWEFEEDHLFAQSYFKKEYFRRLDLTDEDIKEYIYYKDSIGNLQLLDPAVNLRKSAEGFIKWKDKQNERYISDFCIPSIEDYSFSNFRAFVDKRKEIIMRKLEKILFVK